MSQLPSFEVSPSATPREVLYSNDGVITVPVVLDGDRATDGRSPTQSFDIRAGWLVGRIGSTGRWTPCKRTTVNQTNGTGNAVIVSNASPFRTGDVVTIGSNTNLTILTVNYATQTLTLGTSITWTNGSAVFAQDGSGTARGVLLDFARLRGVDNITPASKGARLLVQGLVRTDLLLGDLAAVRSDSNARLAGIRFTDEHGIV